MNKKISITYVDKPEEAAWGIIGQGVHEYNLQEAGELNFQRICFVLQTPEGEILGGVIGEIYWEWFYLDLMWIQENQRGNGYGEQLLKAVEEEAKEKGAKQVFLDTFSFQAPGFYQKYGYRVFGELPDFPPGHQRFYLTKEL
jgi:GNAT superfamily N-acetyltransferase